MRAIELGSTVRRAHLPNLLAKKLFSIVSWLGVKLLDLARQRRLGVQPDLRIKRPRRMVQPILPRVDLVRMNLMALRQVCYRRSASNAILAFSPASIFRFAFVMLRSVLSQNPGPLHSPPPADMASFPLWGSAGDESVDVPCCQGRQRSI
jgi:hypothetical protein